MTYRIIMVAACIGISAQAHELAEYFTIHGPSLKEFDPAVLVIEKSEVNLPHRNVLQERFALHIPNYSQPIGLLWYGANDKTISPRAGYIDQIWVHEQFQSKKLGTLLLNFARDALKKKQCEFVEVLPQPFGDVTGEERADVLTQLIRFYKKHNFEHIAHQPQKMRCYLK